MNQQAKKPVWFRKLSFFFGTGEVARAKSAPKADTKQPKQKKNRRKIKNRKQWKKLKTAAPADATY